MRVWLYWGIRVRVREVYALQKNSHSNNSLVVGLDNDRCFFSDFEVFTLHSCVVIALIFLLQPLYFLTLSAYMFAGNVRAKLYAVNRKTL